MNSGNILCYYDYNLHQTNKSNGETKKVGWVDTGVGVGAGWREELKHCTVENVKSNGNNEQSYWKWRVRTRGLSTKVYLYSAVFFWRFLWEWVCRRELWWAREGRTLPASWTCCTPTRGSMWGKSWTSHIVGTRSIPDEPLRGKWHSENTDSTGYKYLRKKNTLKPYTYNTASRGVSSKAVLFPLSVWSMVIYALLSWMDICRYFAWYFSDLS